MTHPQLLPSPMKGMGNLTEDTWERSPPYPWSFLDDASMGGILIMPLC